MQGRIVEVNYQRGLAIFEDAIGDYGYFEMLSSDALERDDIIFGNLNSLGRETITKARTGKKIEVFIEDHGMSLEVAKSQVYPD